MYRPGVEAEFVVGTVEIAVGCWWLKSAGGWLLIITKFPFGVWLNDPMTSWWFDILCRWSAGWKLLLWFPSVVTVTNWLPLAIGVIRKLDVFWLLNWLALWCMKFSLLISIISLTSCFSSSVVSKCFGGDGTDRKWLFLRLKSSLTLLVSSLEFVWLDGVQLFLFSTISLLLFSNPSLTRVAFGAVAVSLLWLLLSTVAQNFLNFLCRYFESFVVLVKVDVDVTVDELLTGAAGVTSWSFVDFRMSTFVRLRMTDVLLPTELLISSFLPPGSSTSRIKKTLIEWVNQWD